MPARTKNTLGSATPFPHILYSAESECGDCSQLTIWFLVLGLVAVPMILRWVSQTSDQKVMFSSVGYGVSRPAHHQSGNPCNLAHSVGVSLLTV